MSEKSKQQRSSAKNSGAGWAGSKSEWRERVTHQVELWSGQKVLFRFPTLGELIMRGGLPERLIELALLEYGDPGASVKLAAVAGLAAMDEKVTDEQRDAARGRGEQLGHDIAALNRELCAAALVEPAMTADELAEIPLPDLELLSGLVNRTIAYDAVGRRIGVEPLDTFATFREQHKCAEDCPQCEASRRDLSSVHVGDV